MYILVIILWRQGEDEVMLRCILRSFSDAAHLLDIDSF